MSNPGPPLTESSPGPPETMSLPASRPTLRRSFGSTIAVMAGGSFSVGTPYVARWFPRERRGLAMGVAAGITPFNFPAMIPMWMFGVAIAVGAVVVVPASAPRPTFSPP